MLKTVNLFILGIVLSLASCSKNDDSVFGPKYISAPNDLEVVDNSLKIIEVGDEFEIDLPIISFYNPTFPDSVFNPVCIKAELSDSVTWIVTITDLVTDAKKTIIGTSKKVNAVWSGDSENINFFSKKVGDDKNLKIELSFIGIDKKITREIIFQEPKLFSGVILVADFEENGQAVVKGSAGDPDGWFDFFDTDGEDETISRGVGPDNILIAQPSKAPNEFVKSIQGQGYYHLRGDDNSVKPSPFFIGGMGHDAVVYGLPSISPNEVFLNFYANSNGNTTTKVVVELAGFGGDLFTKEIAVNWDGWKLISVRLSDFALTTSGKIGTGEILTPLLESMKFAIHSGGGVAGSIAEINIDYVTFTVGKPFRQQ